MLHATQGIVNNLSRIYHRMYKNNKTPFVFIIFCLLLIGIVTFTYLTIKQQNELFKLILSDNPCSLPCWQNIQPGQSVWDDIFNDDTDNLVSEFTNMRCVNKALCYGDDITTSFNIQKL